jgi:hypothetical protein
MSDTPASKQRVDRILDAIYDAEMRERDAHDWSSQERWSARIGRLYERLEAAQEEETALTPTPEDDR